MKRVSGATRFETKMIAKLSLNGLKTENIAPGSLYVCQYENASIQALPILFQWKIKI